MTPDKKKTQTVILLTNVRADSDWYLLFYVLIAFGLPRYDLHNMVDWALKTDYLSIYSDKQRTLESWAASTVMHTLFSQCFTPSRLAQSINQYFIFTSVHTKVILHTHTRSPIHLLHSNITKSYNNFAYRTMNYQFCNRNDNISVIHLGGWLTLAMSWRLKGPVTARARPMAQQMALILASVSSFRSWGGVTSVASPECTPAFSTCSDTAMHTTSPSLATASTSISCAWKKLLLLI